jgi:hypothetical protein
MSNYKNLFEYVYAKYAKYTTKTCSIEIFYYLQLYYCIK